MNSCDGAAHASATAGVCLKCGAQLTLAGMRAGAFIRVLAGTGHDSRRFALMRIGRACWHHAVAEPVAFGLNDVVRVHHPARTLTWPTLAAMFDDDHPAVAGVRPCCSWSITISPLASLLGLKNGATRPPLRRAQHLPGGRDRTSIRVAHQEVADELDL